MYMHVCIYAHVCMCIQYLQKSKEGDESSGVGVTGGFEPSYMGTGNLTWVFCKNSKYS